MSKFLLILLSLFVEQHSVYSPFLSFCWSLGEIEPPIEFSKTGGRDLKGSQFFVVFTGKEGGDFFEGGLAFLKSEIFSDSRCHK